MAEELEPQAAPVEEVPAEQVAEVPAEVAAAEEAASVPTEVQEA